MIRITASLFLLSVPFIASAASITDFKSFIAVIISLLNATIPVIVALALLLFFWGVFLFLYNADGGPDKEQGGKFMLWGIIALFLMVSMFGVVNIVKSTFFGPSANNPIRDFESLSPSQYKDPLRIDQDNHLWDFEGL